MLFDFHSADIGSDLEADICIIGAGAAGITLAHSLVGAGIRVCLLESGGVTPNASIQGLYDGEDVGVNGALTGTRVRFFGGTTNLWQGYCGPLMRSDFDRRSWVPGSGWPYSRDTLDPYYQRAHELCELGPYAYDGDTLGLQNREIPTFDPEKLSVRFWQRSPPTRFGERYRDSLERASDVVIYLNANVVQLEPDESASIVRRARIRTLEGKTGTVRARCFVLAAGGIENARLLLLSDTVQENGLGNGNDLVGRYFMQHPWLQSGTVIATDRERYQAELSTHLFSEYYKDDLGVGILPGLSPTFQAQEREHILNHVAMLQGGRSTSTGYHDLQRTWRALKRVELPDELGSKLWNVLTDFDEVVDALYSRATGEEYLAPFDDPGVFSQVEQAPNRDSRVTLGNETDELGQRKVRVDWRLSKLEKDTIRTSLRMLGEEFARLGLGRVRLAEWLLAEDSSFPEPLWGGAHHMGTTRMSDNPTEGVVDPNCRMHTVDNLYVAGSSVFPACGYINPTLTIVALSIKLADHLRDQYG